MKKQGFTLIELMVVIVIMGIEVGPAAGTYVKLQQAYFSESNKAGGWQLIGYMAPGVNSATTNFAYTPEDIAVGASDAVTDATVGWAATNSANLNECTAGKNWTVSLQASTSTSNQTDLVFTATANAANHAGCIALTPTFDKIGK